MLQVRNIHKSYTTGSFTQQALNNVSLTLRDNEFVAILGPSGSGKTTLLNIIGGLDHYDSGDLIIDGVSTKKYKDRDWDTYRNNRIGFVFQSYNLIPHQSILANVELALTLSGVSADERKKRAVQALERVGLGQHINKRPNQLSGGQMQRVAIARALINDPEILLADEPTGALDSKTSVQIMDLLTEIAQDRLVVMVTHNPELAQQYATRIVNLADGVITSDSNPYTPTPEELSRVSAKKPRRTSMSMLTALSLSFNNLMTKKGRTIMTAIAGSIGIIGIASILALANGVNNYIASVEEETLSEYPLQITSSAMNLSVSSSGDEDSDSTESATDLNSSKFVVSGGEDELGVTKSVSNIFGSIGSNDLQSLKDYFDSGESGVEPYVNSIEYSYNVQPQIYLSNTEDGVHKVNPDSTFSALGMGSGSSNGLMSMTMSTDAFYQMPQDSELYETSYDVVAGHWPENYNECVLVVSRNGNISDFMLYALGLRDSSELTNMVKAFINEEEVETPTDYEPVAYDTVLNTEYKLVNAADYYEYDSSYGVWKDKSSDTDYLKELVDKSETLRIVGIVCPAEDASVTMLSQGINYPYELTKHIVSLAASSQIVKDQLASPSTDVITGNAFDSSDNSSNFDMSSLFSIDESALANAFTMDESKMQIDTSSLSLDLSGVQIDSSALPDFDMSSVQVDMSDIMQNLDFSSLQLDLDLSSMTVDLSGVEIGNYFDSDKLADNMSTLMANFVTWYTQHSTEYATAKEAASAYFNSSSEVKNAIVNSFDNQAFTNDVLEALEPQLEPQVAMQASAQLVPQITASLTQAIVQSIGTSLQNAMAAYMQQAMTSMATQLGTAIQQQVTSAMTTTMSQLSTSMANAISLDADAFANAFSVNMDADDLTDIMLSMSNTEERSYDNNLKDFGYADLNKPYEISIYPIDFESKAKVIEVLDEYNAQMEQIDENKVITYTDIVGLLMTSVTDIVDMISMVLIAFVAISLIVSSIMIGVITYISVLERIKEIGILRAIGASKKDISHVFNAETIIEGLVSGLLGVGVTALGCAVANVILVAAGFPAVAQLPVNAAVILVIISVVLTFISGLLPARSASKKDPVEALRSE